MSTQQPVLLYIYMSTQQPGLLYIYVDSTACPVIYICRLNSRGFSLTLREIRPVTLAYSLSQPTIFDNNNNNNNNENNNKISTATYRIDQIMCVLNISYTAGNCWPWRTFHLVLCLIGILKFLKKKFFSCMQLLYARADF